MPKHTFRPVPVPLALVEPTPAPGDLVYTIPETAKLFKQTTRTIYNMINSGKLQSISILGSRRIPASEIRRVTTLGTFVSAAEMREHYERTNAENLAFAEQELRRRAQTRPELLKLLETEA